MTEREVSPITFFGDNLRFYDGIPPESTTRDFRAIITPAGPETEAKAVEAVTARTPRQPEARDDDPKVSSVTEPAFVSPPDLPGNLNPTEPETSLLGESTNPVSAEKAATLDLSQTLIGND